MKQNRFSHGAGRVALVAVMAALSLMVLALSCVVPTGRLGLVALAGLVVAAPVVSAGVAAGGLCYGATGLLGLMLLPAKENVVLYLAFFGLYPLLKHGIEQLKKAPLEWLCKLICFHLITGLLWAFYRAALLSALPRMPEGVLLSALVLTLVFVVYDLGCTQCIGLYARRVDRAVRKG